MFHFPISGVETYWWVPLVVSFLISLVTSTGGVSGAFILLPFQMSVLGFVGPSVSSTNLLFNIVAIPSGVFRYARDRRMVWPLAWTIVITTLPGILAGALIRIVYLPDPRSFKLFAAFVLAYLGIRLCLDLLKKSKLSEKAPNKSFEVSSPSMSLKQVSYLFNGVAHRVATWKLFLLSFVVGIVGGTYGIGGGAMIAPILVTVFRLPVHSVAGACLFGTFVSSIGGVLFYTGLAPLFGGGGNGMAASVSISPDWLLGLLFGVGGAAGMYLGARFQRFVPARVIKTILAAAMLFIAGKYVLEFFSFFA